MLELIFVENEIEASIFTDSIVDSVQTHSKRPSFCTSTATDAETLELTWDGSKFTGSVTDTTVGGALGSLSITAAGIWSYSVANAAVLAPLLSIVTTSGSP